MACLKSLKFFLPMRLYFFLVLMTVNCSGSGSNPESPKTVVSFDHTHSLWNSVLLKYTTAKEQTSVVNYRQLKAEPALLLEYLRQLESVSKADFERFDSNQRLAFLINAYNAFTIKLIVDHYPLKSIKKIGSFFSSPWKIKFINILGTTESLDYIEHELIRNNFNEPRIHFAVVCASAGCPALRREAFIATKLDQQLEDAAKNFLTDKSKNRFDSKTKQLELSSIFEWYGSDFEKKFGSVEAFIADKITSISDEQKIIQKKSVKIVYLDYDWSLNE